MKTEKSQNKSSQGLWNKIKSLFFGNSDFDYTDKNKLDGTYHDMLLQVPQVAVFKENSTLSDWIRTVDILQPLVQTIRDELDPNRVAKFDLEILGASTYLYHVDRLVVKIREYFLTFRYRLDQYGENNELLRRSEVTQVKKAGLQCYRSMTLLIVLLQKLPHKRIYSEEFISQIHALEIEVSTLANAMRSLNNVAYRQETVHQFTQLEQALIETFSQTNRGGHGLTTQSAMYLSGDNLRMRLKEISSPQHLLFISNIIEAHEMLKKCYVVARKAVIKDTLDIIAEHTEQLIAQFSNETPDKDKVFVHLHYIFNGIESLRFSSNRESRCSRNLFDKAKLARHQLRKACTANPMGQEFLKEIAVKRSALLKSS